MNGPAFSLPVTVFYEDTDAAGIVYHANYLRYAERARSEWLRSKGAPVNRLLELFDGYFVVKSCSIDFRLPGKLGDQLIATAKIETSKGARMTMHQTIERDGTVLADLSIDIAFVGSNGRPRRIPAALLAA